MAKDARIVPKDMPSQGGAAINENPSESLRNPAPSVVNSEGPVRGDNDEYLPAVYEVSHQVPTVPGAPLVYEKMIREDR